MLSKNNNNSEQGLAKSRRMASKRHISTSFPGQGNNMSNSGSIEARLPANPYPRTSAALPAFLQILADHTCQVRDQTTGRLSAPQMIVDGSQGWAPFTIHFECPTAAGNNPSDLHQAVWRFVNSIGMAAPLGVLCDTHPRGGSINFYHPDQVLKTVTNIINNSASVYRDTDGLKARNDGHEGILYDDLEGEALDQVAATYDGLARRAQTMRSKDFCEVLPPRTYLSLEHAKVALLANHDRMQAHKCVIDTTLLENAIAADLNLPIPHPLARLH